MSGARLWSARGVMRALCGAQARRAGVGRCAVRGAGEARAAGCEVVRVAPVGQWERAALCAPSQTPPRRTSCPPSVWRPPQAAPRTRRHPARSAHSTTQESLRKRALRGTHTRPRATRCEARATRTHAARCVGARIGAVRRVRRVKRGEGVTTCLRVVRDADGANVTLDLHPLRTAATARVRAAARAPGGVCAHLVALGILEVIHHCKHTVARQSVRRAVEPESRPRGAAQSSAPFEKLRTATGATLSEGHAEPALRRRPLATWRSIVEREERGRLRCHVSVHNF